MGRLSPYIATGPMQALNAGSGKSKGNVFICPDLQPKSALSAPLQLRRQRPSSGAMRCQCEYHAGTGAHEFPPTGSRSRRALWQAFSLRRTRLSSRKAPGNRVYTHGDDVGPWNDPDQGDTGVDRDNNIVHVLARNRHAGGSNFLFVDGHVKWFLSPAPQLHRQRFSGNSRTVRQCQSNRQHQRRCLSATAAPRMPAAGSWTM